MDNSKLTVTVRNKVPEISYGDYLVSDNKQLRIVFDLDSEWDAYAHKTARFNLDGWQFDIAFTGDTVTLPLLPAYTGELKAGLYAGDLATTTAVSIPVRDSVLAPGDVISLEDAAEMARVAAEASRVDAENARAAAELQRQQAQSLQGAKTKRQGRPPKARELRRRERERAPKESEPPRRRSAGAAKTQGSLPNTGAILPSRQGRRRRKPAKARKPHAPRRNRREQMPRRSGHRANAQEHPPRTIGHGARAFARRRRTFAPALRARGPRRRARELPPSSCASRTKLSAYRTSLQETPRSF